MKKNWTYTGLVGLLLLFMGCAEVNFDKEEETQKLMQLSREWSEVASTGNIDSLMTYWADDAVMMPPDQPPLRGKEAIRSFIEASGQVPGFEVSWEPLSAHISNDGSMAYLIEKNQMAFNDSLGSRVVENNKVVTVWRKNEDGSWKNVIDMWNSDPSQK
ncbi:MAG: nuclear transport factor 2 family protein [Gracilimonas sp.]|uniref:YybH family protein n=1 Tax=Gracilimonas sp. TaxID=1974203 RepID=UPI0019C4A834|nr:nuclear transport factor 2 family protein [Gracilimonas sp.]MBD3615178.1 nuclear transport factor 2 family protein [Gracilimonas sp.]